MSSIKELTARCATLEARCTTLEEVTKALHARNRGLEEALEEFKIHVFEPLRKEFDVLRPRIEGRNKSSSEKRDMTDVDALACLTGDYKGFGHKTAAEQMGLTYAQIYSCRLEYTFKHVHKDLRDGGWKNPWAKK